MNLCSYKTFSAKKFRKHATISVVVIFCVCYATTTKKYFPKNVGTNTLVVSLRFCGLFFLARGFVCLWTTRFFQCFIFFKYFVQFFSWFFCRCFDLLNVKTVELLFCVLLKSSLNSIFKKLGNFIKLSVQQKREKL